MQQYTSIYTSASQNNQIAWMMTIYNSIMHDSSLCWSIDTCITVGSAPTGTEGDLDSPLGDTPLPLVGCQRRTEMGSFHWSVPMGSTFICRTWGLKLHSINRTNRVSPMEASFSYYWVQQLKTDSVDNIPICSMMNEKLPWVNQSDLCAQSSKSNHSAMVDGDCPNCSMQANTWIKHWWGRDFWKHLHVRIHHTFQHTESL